MVRDKRCLDLSAGCGLVAVVMSHMRPTSVVATDLVENIPLLQRNCTQNAPAAVNVAAMPYKWGDELTGLLEDPFDLIVACDVMYSRSHVSCLVSSLEKLITDNSVALICHGRNAHAEEEFLNLCHGVFLVSEIDWNAFDPNFKSEEIECFKLKKLDRRTVLKGPV